SSHRTKFIPFAMSDTNLQDIFDNFDYVPNDYDDLESITFAESLIARILIKEDEKNDIFLLKDIDTNTKVDVNTSTISIFDLESTTSGSTDGNEYFVINTTNASESLSECPILDINNSSIQCCSSYLERQRPLFQLIRA
ncbi:14096_t:CDS:2, partial [Funneliformis caledonium]